MDTVEQQETKQKIYRLWDFLRHNIKAEEISISRKLSEIESLLTVSVVRELAQNPKWNTPLSSLPEKLGRYIEFHIRHHLFAMHEEIPQQELLKLWYENFFDRTIVSLQELILDGELELLSNQNFREKPSLKNHPITDPLLIDNKAVRHRYCQIRKPGWKFLRYADGNKGRKAQKLKRGSIMQKALEDLSFPAFCIALDVTGKNVTFSHVDKILWSFDPCREKPEKQINLLRELRENNLMPDKKSLPIPELFCHVVSQFPDCVSIPYLEILEEFYPGVIKEWRDVFGRNLLWYAMYNMMTCWCHPDCKLIPFLIARGCDPCNKNQIGLSWNCILKNLSPLQKRKSLSERYNFHGGKIYYGSWLRQTQLRSALVCHVQHDDPLELF